MEEEEIPFEIIIMDDGSKDHSYQVALGLEESDLRIRAYRLSKNYTTPYAQFAALSVCKGDCAVFFPDDMQRPLSSVIEMYRAWEKGAKIAIGYKRSRNDGYINDWFSNTYYKIMNRISDVQFPPGGFDGFLADREVIDILTQRIRPINTSTVVEVLHLGFDPVFIPYDRPKANQKSRWTFKKKWKLAKDTFFASSTFPIKFISYLGFFNALFAFGLILLIVYAKLYAYNQLFGLSIPGWATTVVFITFFSGLILFSLGIVAEYIWRIFDEVKNRPGYIIRDKSADHLIKKSNKISG